MVRSSIRNGSVFSPRSPHPSSSSTALVSNATSRTCRRAAKAAGVRLRPHAKTHKSPAIAQKQVEAGAIGICCAKLGEAEVFAASGIGDIRLPYPMHPANAARVVALMPHGDRFDHGGRP